MKPMPSKKPPMPLILLKIILWIYILLCLVIAGLNFGVAPGADAQTSEIISRIWHFYENEFKTLMIILCSILSVLLMKKNVRNRMRKQNLIGLLISALIIHIIAPRLTGTGDLYYFSMPVPWSSLSFRIFDPESPFRAGFISSWGLTGPGAITAFVIFFNVFIFAGTLLFGRRLQCSQVCMFNGFAAEVFSDAMPLAGKKLKRPGKKLRVSFSFLRAAITVFALAVGLYTLLAAAGLADRGTDSLLSEIETWKYISIELLLTMLFWVILSGRGYCYYCPAGTVLSWVSRLGGQKIAVDAEKCISCGKCDRVCPMSVELSSNAAAGIAVKSPDCVGCGHCIDACPTGALSYSTAFLDIISRSKRFGKA